MEISKTFALTNGFASGMDFDATMEKAISECVRCSNQMNTRNWLFIKSEDGRYTEIGHTYKDGYNWYYTEQVKSNKEN